MDTIQIKCPNDGTLLKVRNVPGIERKSLTCPVCKQKMPFSKMIIVGANPNEESGTQYPGQTPKSPVQSPTPTPSPTPDANNYITQFPGAVPPPIPQASQTVASLVHRTSGMRYTLRPGVNIIGRQATRSAANIQLPSSPMRRMSREHIKIDVQNMGGSYRYICSLFKPDCNPTFINGMPLQYGNSFILQPGMIITLPDCELLFTI